MIKNCAFNMFKKIFSSLFEIKSNSSRISKQNYNESDLKKMNIKGKVKSINLIPFDMEAKNGRLQKGKPVQRAEDYNCYYYLFNEFGNKLERRQSHEDFNTVSGEKYYGERYSYDKKNWLSERCFYDYNRYKDEFFTERKVVLIYNNKGEIIAKKILDEENKYQYEINYFYDQKGNKTERLVVPGKYGTWKIFPNKIKYYYDDLKKMIRKEDFQHHNSIQKTYNYKYDSSGNLVYEETISNIADRFCKIDYKRNSFGDVITEKIDSKLSAIHEYKYDELGNWTSKETCYIEHIITNFNDYSDFIIAKWIIDSGENPYMGYRVLIEREVKYY